MIREHEDVIDIVGRGTWVPLTFGEARDIEDQNCYICGLPISGHGAAELLLLASPDPQTLWLRLAHPACGASTVLETTDLPESAVRMEIECALVGVVGADPIPAVFIDCRGGWRIAPDGRLVDLTLDYFRSIGFRDVVPDVGNDPAQISMAAHATASPSRPIAAHLVKDTLPVKAGTLPLITNARLSFLPAWYEAVRDGALAVYLGRNLHGMSWENPEHIQEAAQTGQLVGQYLPVSINSPGRNDRCTAHPAPA